MTLAEIQALFHEAITSPEPPAPERLEACFAGTPELPASDRVAIYTGMYLGRLVDALRQTFPALARLLGDEAFFALAADYLRRNPSDHHDIAQVGRRLARFLREYPDPERPDLADLAELEWAGQVAFFAPGSEAIGPDALACLGPEAFTGARLALSPSLQVLELQHDVIALWRALQREEPPPPPAAVPTSVAVWRSGFDVLHAPLAPEDARALALARFGGSLAEICGAFEGSADPAPSAHAALSSWVSQGWVVRVLGG